ncbi:MAG: hypothetical protein KC468_19785 [Myxococcales bacterium]|nr:hypothetical protein [Myxococcales bacterium]
MSGDDWSAKYRTDEGKQRRKTEYHGTGISVESLSRHLLEDDAAKLEKVELKVGGLVAVEVDDIDEVHVQAMREYLATGDIQFLADLNLTDEELEEELQKLDALDEQLERELASDAEITEAEIAALEHLAPDADVDERIKAILRLAGAPRELLELPPEPQEAKDSETVALEAMLGAGVLEDVLAQLKARR